jgi:hypothetical protein
MNHNTMNEESLKSELSTHLKNKNIPFIGIGIKSNDLDFEIKIIVDNSFNENKKAFLRFDLYEYLRRMITRQEIKNFELKILTQKEQLEYE